MSGSHWLSDTWLSLSVLPFSVGRVWDKASGFPDSWWACCSSRALAMAGQRDPWLPAHMRGLCTGAPLGGDSCALHTQASLEGCWGGEGHSYLFCLSCIKCPCITAASRCPFQVGRGGILPVSAKLSSVQTAVIIQRLILYIHTVSKFLRCFHILSTLLLNIYHHCN